MPIINADERPIFKELHRPDPKRAPDHQDKRMVVILPRGPYMVWLDAPAQQSQMSRVISPAGREQQVNTLSSAGRSNGSGS